MRDCRAAVNIVGAAHQKPYCGPKRKVGKAVGAAILFSLCNQLGALLGPDDDVHFPTHSPDMNMLDEDLKDSSLHRTFVTKPKGITQRAADSVSFSGSGSSPGRVFSSDPSESMLVGA